MPTRSRRCWPRTARNRTARLALIGLLSLPIATALVSAQAQELAWDALQKEGRVRQGVVTPPEPGAPFHSLRVEGRGTGPITVVTIEAPRIKGPRYALVGQVRYEEVEGTGYLELWNHFPDGRQFFSRTLADSGPMMRLQGTSGWRPFTLPFDATGAPPPPKLVVNVPLAGRGVVYLGPVQIVDGAPEADLASGSMVDRISALFGSLAGGVIGGLGALIGVLTSLGRARRFVTLAAAVLIAGGFLTFALGVAGLGGSQPYAVSYPRTLLLIGFLAAVVPLSLLPAIRRRYEALELRRMRAHDLA